PDAVTEDAGLTAPRPLRHVIDVVVENEVTGGSERLPITAFDTNAAVAEIVQVATPDRVIGPAMDAHAVVAEVAHRAAGKRDMRTTLDDHAVAARTLQRQAAELDVAGVLHVNQRRLQ